MPELSKRVGKFTDSVIRRMTRISDAYGAINLSQGFPDFDPPKEIMDALADVAYKGPHQYYVTFGAPNFREALAKKQGKAINRTIDPDKELDKIGLKHNVPQGTYFVLVDISEYLELPQFQNFTDLEFCEWMIKNIGVAAVPGSSFFKEDVNSLIRLHFAREKETLDEALRRLAKLRELLP